MSLDIAPLLALGTDLAGQAIRTSGTVVTLSRNPGGKARAVTDRTTLEVTDPTPIVTVASGLPAIVIAETSSADQPQGPNVDRQRDAYRVILLPEVTDVRAYDEVTIDACLDARLAGRTLRVERVADGTAGAVRVLQCEAP